jgi:hypothetical protein
MLNLKSLPLVLGVLAVVVWVSPSKASIVQALDLDELVAQADQILLGRVVFSESFQRPNGTIGTWHRIQIERDVRGSAADEREVMVETLGGSLGDVAMRVEGDGAYQAFRPVGMGQGVMRVRTEEGVDRVRQTGAGMLLMRRNAQGVLEKSRGALPHEERLETFLSRVRRILDRKPSGTDE